MSEYLIGVDLGQANDYTAISVLHRAVRVTPSGVPYLQSWMAGEKHKPPVREAVYEARHLERLPLGTPYPQQVERVARIVAEVKNRDDVRLGDAAVRLVVDQTGVGRPVVDMLRAAGLKGLYAVSIHGGDATTRDGNEYRAPKRELVSVLQVLLQTGRLGVAASLPEAQTLTREMLAFKVTFNTTGHDTYANDWRENPHDDMVLAVALAAWAGERIPRPGMVRYSLATA